MSPRIGQKFKANDDLDVDLIGTIEEALNFIHKKEEELLANVTPEIFIRLKGKDFWDWNEGEKHQAQDKDGDGQIDCCFNHIMGLPQNKPGLPRTIFNFQKQYLDLLFEKTNDITDKHLWIKKATGIGGTAIFLRVMVWLATRDDALAGSHMCIVTGPNQSLANDLIQRVRELFIDHPEVQFPVDSVTRIQIKNVMFQAYPSNNMKAMRGIDRTSFILADENPRTIIERYVGKWDPWIVVMSTPNLKDDMFGSIEFEQNPIYKRLLLPYTIGLGKIYTEEEIHRAKATPSFRREYELEYLGAFGDAFTADSIALAEKQGLECESIIKGEIRQDTHKAMGVDAGWSKSAFAVTITQLNPQNGKIEVLYAEEFVHPDFNDMIDLIIKMKYNYQVEKIFVDASNNPVITTLKKLLGEREDYQEELKKRPRAADRWYVVPVSFNAEGRKMLIVTKWMLDTGWLAIHPKFEKLLASLRTATAREGVLDKGQTAHDDVLDALRLSLRFYNLPETK